MTIQVTSKIRVAENTPAGKVVGSIFATSDDPNDTFTFTLADNSSSAFEFVGNKVVVAAGANLDSEAWPDHAIVFTVTDDQTGEALFTATFVHLVDLKGVTIRETTEAVTRGRLFNAAPHSGQVLHGTGEEDHIVGGSGNDHIFGLGGYDVLFGGQGNDVLVGGPGWDRMRGGPGADRFVFGSMQDFNINYRLDIVRDFHSDEGDVIDLRGIDANQTLPGNQPFVFVKGFSHDVGELIAYGFSHKGTYKLRADTDGDQIDDFALIVIGSHPHHDDFLL